MYHKVKADIFLKEMFGMEYDLFAETVIVMPIWNLEDFRKEADKVLTEFKGWYKGMTLEFKGKPITVLNSGIGAPLTGDCVLAMAHSKNVKNVIFTGSAGAVNRKYKIGDFLFSSESVIGEGYSRYVRGLEKDCFGELSYGDVEYTKELSEKAKDLIEELGTKLHFGRNFSTDSILGENTAFFNYLEKKGCDSVEMEASAVFTAAQEAKKRVCAILLISDLPMEYRNLFEGISPEEQLKFDLLRKKIARLLLEIGISN